MNDSRNPLTPNMYLALISLDEMRARSCNGATWLAIERARTEQHGDCK
jgi:hypothetical protein